MCVKANPSSASVSARERGVTAAMVGSSTNWKAASSIKSGQAARIRLRTSNAR